MWRRAAAIMARRGFNRVLCATRRANLFAALSEVPESAYDSKISTGPKGRLSGLRKRPAKLKTEETSGRGGHAFGVGARILSGATPREREGAGLVKVWFRWL